MPDTATDPLTLVHDAIWATLWAHVPLANLVRTGNRVQFGGEGKSLPHDELSIADLPELRLVPAGCGPGPAMDSSGREYVLRYVVGIATGEQVVTGARSLHPVQWETLRALHGWQTKLMALTLNGRRFVLHCMDGEVTQGVTDPEYNRGIKGWSAIQLLEVRLWFTNADLAPTP